MAILEINLEKPALIEERQSPSESHSGGTRTTGGSRTVGGSRTTGGTRTARDSGGGKGKLVGALVLLAGVALVAWRLKSRGSDQYESEEYDHGPEPDIGADESGGVRSKVAGVVGLAVAVVSVVALIRRVRN